jgi:hypothetical protein
MGEAARATISCSTETRNKIRQICGHERNYDELLREWIKEHEKKQMGDTQDE